MRPAGNGGWLAYPVFSRPSDLSMTNRKAEIVVHSHAESSSSKSSCTSTCRRIRSGYRQALPPIRARWRRAMKPATSQIIAPGLLGSRHPAAASALLSASAQNKVQNRCAWAHRGSMPTSSMIRQKAACRRRSIADRAMPSRTLSDRAAFERPFRCEAVNFMSSNCRRVCFHPNVRNQRQETHEALLFLCPQDSLLGPSQSSL